jgi:hypothetical protein
MQKSSLLLVMDRTAMCKESKYASVDSTILIFAKSKFTLYTACNILCSKILISYTECPRKNVPDFGRVFLMLKYTDITQNTYVQSWAVTEIMAREKWGLLSVPRTIPISWRFVLDCFSRKLLSGISSVFIAPAVEAGVLSESVTYSAWNSRDSYEMVCGFFVVQFNGITSHKLVWCYVHY